MQTGVSILLVVAHNLLSLFPYTSNLLLRKVAIRFVGDSGTTSAWVKILSLEKVILISNCNTKIHDFSNN